MALKETIYALKQQVDALQKDLRKASLGVKAASQRVRMGTIHLAKIAKLYRKESVASEKSRAQKTASAKKRAKKSVAKKARAKRL